MALAAGLFWVIEAQPYVRKLKELKKEHANATANVSTIRKYASNTAFTIKTGAHIYLLLPLGIDLFITSSLASMLGFGGMVGGIIGLFISNIISLFIIVVAASMNGK